MSARALAEAIRGLVPAGLRHYVGQVPTGTGALPWVVSNQSIPAVVERSLAATAHGSVGSVLLTVASTSENAVLDLLDTLHGAFEGARVSVPGWSVSPLAQHGSPSTFVDDVTIAGQPQRVMVGKVTYRYTAVRTT